MPQFVKLSIYAIVRALLLLDSLYTDWNVIHFINIIPKTALEDGSFV